MTKGRIQEAVNKDSTFPGKSAIHYPVSYDEQRLRICTRITRCIVFNVAEYGILVMSMHPGWVLTEMGGPNALIDTETCAKTMLETLYALTEKDHGSFLRYNNTPIQW